MTSDSIHNQFRTSGPQSQNREAQSMQTVRQTDSCDSLADADHATRRSAYQSVSGLFSGILAEASIVKFDPVRCISIPQLRSRPICRWGVKKIKHSILGNAGSETFVNGFVSTGKFSVIAEVPAERIDLIVQFFVDKGESREEAEARSESGKWYHIIEGGHVQQALVECIREFSEKFAGFRWPVVVISWQSDETLRAIGRMCNEMQKDDHVIDFPLPDAMQSLRNIIDAHSKRTGVAIIPGERTNPGFIKEVVEIYAGRQGYACNTLRTVCGSVMKMSSSFVDGMRSLLTEECEELWMTLGSKRPFGDDTRLFKRLISTQSLKRTPNFLDPKFITDEDRLSVIHRLRFIAKERESFKAFSSSEIENQSHNVLAAKREVTKFDAFLEGEPWPSDLENLKHNMLETTLLDGVVKEHTGGQQDLLPAMVSAYLKATGAHGSQKLGQHRRMLELERDSDELIRTTSCRRKRRSNIREDDENEPCERVAVDNVENIVAVETRTENADENRDVMRDPNAILKKAGVELRIETVLEYERGSLGIDGSFDFIIAEPFQKVGADPSEEGRHNRSAQSNRVLEELIDDKGVKMFIQCVRRLLRRGGYLLVFLEWSRIDQWKSCCTDSQLEVVCEPFLVMKDPTRVQKMTLKGLQCIYEPALIMKKPGKHPDDFELDKSSPYSHLPACGIPRWCNVIDGLPPPAQKVTFKPSRAQVRPNEKPCSLFIELLTTFCPPGGNVLDPFAGALTTGLACMATGRSCVLLEADEKCVLYAKPRAVEFAKSRRIEQGSRTNQNSTTVNVVIQNMEQSENGRKGSETSETEDEIGQEDVGNGDENSRDGNEETSGEETETSPNRWKSNRDLKDVDSPSSSQPEYSSNGRSRAGKKTMIRNVGFQSSSQTAKQLSFLSSDNSAELELNDVTVSKAVQSTSARSEVSTPILKKRNRKTRSPRGMRKPVVESNTPSAVRRSKRSRKVAVRYEK